MSDYDFFAEMERDTQHITRAMRRRSAAEEAMEREKSLSFALYLAGQFGAPIAVGMIAGFGAGVWAIVLIILISLLRAALDFVLRLFGVRYGQIVNIALSIVPITVFFSLPMAFGAGSEMGVSIIQSVLAAVALPGIIFLVFYIREQVSPLDDYIDNANRWN